ncbi:hypothetical protein ACFE04_025068 [Oxalis oulophora]
MTGPFTGKNKSNSKSVFQGIPPETLPAFSQSSNIFSTKPHESSLVTGQSKVDMLGDRKNRGLDISERSHPESVVASNILSPYPDLTKSWSPNSVSLSSSLNQNSLSARMHPCLDKSPQSSSAQCQGIFRDKWHLKNNNNFRLKPSNESESSDQNGFFYRSSSGSKEVPICIPSAHYEYLNCNNNRNLTSEQFSNNSSAGLSKDSNCVNVNFAKDMNQNVAILNRSADDVAPQRSSEILESGQKHIAMFPWLQTPPACNNKPNGTTHLSDQNAKSAAGCSIVEGKTVTNNSTSTTKILGVSIIDKPSHTIDNLSLGTVQSGEVKNNGRYRLFDINLPCEQTEAGYVDLEKGNVRKEDGFRPQIDLNMCMSEYEASVTSPVPGTSIKRVAEFDLEAPVALESDDDVLHGEPTEKVLEAPRQIADLAEDSTRMAAEAIVSISSSNLENNSNNVICDDAPEESTRDPLQWLAGIASCCGEELENKYEVIARMNGGANCGEEIDYFEYLTLNLKEATEEEFMPKPLVPEHIKLDDEAVGPARVHLRPRKGQARRGRQQRKDFQRDILPGLPSLSRLEITEDIQTFGGLMEATGHAWAGMLRRNSTRGRRRTVATTPPRAVTPIPPPPPNNIEVMLEDRNLTGWGKTTRRPRRQRCPPATAVPLT